MQLLEAGFVGAKIVKVEVCVSFKNIFYKHEGTAKAFWHYYQKIIFMIALDVPMHWVTHLTWDLIWLVYHDISIFSYAVAYNSAPNLRWETYIHSYTAAHNSLIRTWCGMDNDSNYWSRCLIIVVNICRFTWQYRHIVSITINRPAVI